MTIIAANDNRKAFTRLNDGPTPEWLAERNAAGTATTYRHTGNRIERALVKGLSPLVATLRQIAELMRPAETATTVDIESAEDRDDAPNTGFGAERVHNQGAFTPSLPVLFRAYADGMRVRVVSKAGKIVGRVCTTYHHDRHGETVTIGGTSPGSYGRMKFHGLQFYRGELVFYGDEKGRKLTPKYVADPVGLSYQKGSLTEQHVERAEQDNASYLRLAGGKGWSMTTITHDNAPRSPSPPVRTKAADRAAAILANAANDNVPITKLPDGVAHCYGRLAGISESSGLGATSAPRHDALAEMDRADDFAALDLERADRDLIESMLDGESFRTIGLGSGSAESSAHKTGRRIVEQTLEKLSKKIAA